VFYRKYSSATIIQEPLIPLRSTKFYANADSDKIQILTDNKGKAGVYRWTNLTNGKTYVGSSTNIYTRLITYYNIDYLLKNNMTIYK